MPTRISTLAIGCAAMLAGGAPAFANGSKYGAFAATPWTGAYIGLHAGMGWASMSLSGTGGGDVSLDGFVGGGHVGYNVQTANLLFGIEVDFDGTAIDRTATFGTPGGPATVTAEINSVGTVRGRLGVVHGSTLFYGTGGFAWGNVDANVTALRTNVDVSATAVGFAAGGGIEHRFTKDFSGRIEALYYGFEDHQISLLGTTYKIDTHLTVLRVGASWHFN